MKILSSAQIREADAYTITHEPIASHLLMKRAAEALFSWITKRYDAQQEFEIFCGNGNNGGDGFALACLLKEANYPVRIYHFEQQEFSPDAARYREETLSKNIETILLDSNQPAFNPKPNSILIDALFGTGLNRPVEGYYGTLIELMNESKHPIISIDIPSGLASEQPVSSSKQHIVHADFTLSFQLPKLSFLFPENENLVGQWEILPIGLHPEGLKQLETPYELTEPEALRSFLKERKRFDHKGKFGHSFLIAGGYGKIGAAILSGKACLRTGTGLLTIHVPRLGYEVVQTSLPEAMVSIDSYDKLISKIPSTEHYSAVGIGPGIGKTRHTMQALADMMSKCVNPLVIDADAINLIAENRELIDLIPKGTILTPHLKEFERLVGPAANHYERIQKQMEFASQKDVIVVLKGAYTSIAEPGGKCYFNPSGNPGMAKGGSGDVLTGMIISFLSQGYSGIDASRLAVYLHGRAGDIACHSIEPECMLAGDIIDCIGKAFKELKEFPRC